MTSPSGTAASPHTSRVSTDAAATATASRAVTASAAATVTASTSAAACRDPADPTLIRDCDAPPIPTFQGDRSAYVKAITDCMAASGWRVTMGDDLSSLAAPQGLSGSQREKYGADALACLQTVGSFTIANASDGDVSRYYGLLHQQWTCLKDQGLPVRPAPPLTQVLAEFHRTHTIGFDPLVGLPDPDYARSYCPSPADFF